MRRTAAKALTGMLCATLALVGGLVLTGCSGADPEEAVRADLTANFDQLKNLEGDALEEIADGMGNTGLEQYGLENTEVITAMLDGFDYTIDSVAVDGDTATAEVTVTSKSMSELMNLDTDALTADLMEAITSGELDPNDDDAINAWAGEYMMGLVEQIEPSEKTISLTYVNGEDGWTMDDSSASEVAQIFV